MKILIVVLALVLYFSVFGNEEELICLEPFEISMSEEYQDEMHPVPEGFKREEYYSRKWEIEKPYELEFSGEYYGDRPIFTFTFHEVHPHAFPGFELKEDLFFPRYLGFIECVEGEWKEVKMGYCGTGDQAFILYPHRKYRVVLGYLEDGAELQKIILRGPSNMDFISEVFDTSKSKEFEQDAGCND